MSKFRMGQQFKDVIERQKADAEALNTQVKKDSEDFTKAICNIGDTSETGGAGTGVLVATPAYKKWLATVQKRNIFIGKSYMQKADEFARDDEETKEARVIGDDEASTIMSVDEDGMVHISEDYDPNNAEEVDNEKLVGDAAKFSDLCVINNVISRQLTWDFDSLMDEVTTALKDAHLDDLDFELPENLEEQVDKALKHSEAIAAITYSKDEKEQKTKNSD